MEMNHNLKCLAQARPLPAGVFRALAPTEAAHRASLSPAVPERVSGDPRPPVPLPPPLSHIVESATDSRG